MDGDQQSAKIFIELVVKAMESDEFQIVMKQVFFVVILYNFTFSNCFRSIFFVTIVHDRISYF